MKKYSFILMLTVIYTVNLPAQKYEANWESIDSRPTPQWFADAKFGIFIHWGVYSVPAWSTRPSDGARGGDCFAESYWIQLMNPKRINPAFKAFHNKTYGEGVKYQDFVKDFTCEMFNPDDWVNLFHEAGARYVVLTSKHAEGFALWPSALAWNWNAVDVGPHRDLVGDLSDAVKKKGLHMGLYYSFYEWFNPLYHDNLEKYVDDRFFCCHKCSRCWQILWLEISNLPL
ncbi:hypothetical protein FACS189464_4270 [Bacteroidia bacterium]|nr:hypothetical protein FACS189464_4270 [Bacteroidia bacterium]